MKKILTLICISISISVSSQDPFQKEAIGFLSFTKGKIDQLANAIPEEKYSWAPADSVRSFSGVIAHTITSNYFLGLKLGGELPQGVNPMTIEKEITEKADLLEALTVSHNFIVTSISNLKTENLSDRVELPFPGEYTKMTVVNVLISHASEHLGQLIAYARTNGIAPPWSVEQ